MRRRYVLLPVLACAGGLLAGSSPASAKDATARGDRGAAATVDTLATRAAIRTLRRGGNAVDAAVSAAGVLGVTEPFSAGIGGGGFMLVYDADTRKITTIDHRETAPERMTPESFIENGTPLPFAQARYSGLSVGVPGTVAGWEQALERYGTWSLRQALREGTSVARRGFVIDQTFFDQTAGNVAWFDDIPATRALYLDADGTPRDVGTRLRNPDLAKTYRLIAREGARGFYRGELAGALVRAVRNPPVAEDADHAWRPGVMIRSDLRRYESIERDPTKVTFGKYAVFGMGPPSSGGSTVGEILRILRGYDLESASRVQALHWFLEASRYSFADRNAYLADPEYFRVPLEGLLSRSFARERRALITQAAANRSVPAGDPYDDQGEEAPPRAASATIQRGVETTHLTVSDREGNVVSYTFTIESTGGAGIVVPGYGFLLNNELTDFNYDSTTHPNRVQGGKRPRSSMAPTIVLRNRRPALAVGSPGGSTIITTVAQILLDTLGRGESLPDAIAAPRATQRNTAATNAEAEFIASPEGQALAAPPYGHRLSETSEIGAATGIAFGPGEQLLAAAEPVRRGGGHAMVVRRR